MFIVIGLVIVLGCVFGVYIAVGGNMEIVAHALPHEFATIGGASLGAFIVANSLPVLKKAGAGFGNFFWLAARTTTAVNINPTVRRLRIGSPLLSMLA